MTRFKEGQRIENAIKHKDEKELLWAISYCKSRLSLAKLKQHIKHWKNLIHELERALNDENK
jgi:hypothetical protein